MALQHKTLGKTYLRYLFAGLGSAVIVSIYSIVDAIMVGKYEGSNGCSVHRYADLDDYFKSRFIVWCGRRLSHV